MVPSVMKLLRLTEQHRRVRRALAEVDVDSSVIGDK